MGERGLLAQAELTPQERRLCAMVVEGRLLDLRCGRAAEDDPTRGPDWGPERQVRAQVLVQLLTGQGPQLSNDLIVAVRLQGAAIVGRLNLGGLKLRCSMELSDCYLSGRLDLAKAEAPNLSLRGSYLRKGLSARRLEVAHSLNLTGRFRCDSRVDLRSAHIGVLDCSGATLANGGREALNADGLVVDGNLVLSNARLDGQLRLSGAAIKGVLACEQATLTNPSGVAVSLERASVTQAVYLWPASLEGGIILTHARVGVWYDEKRTWPASASLWLDGFIYQSINAKDASTVKDRLGWLRHHQGGFVPQPYEQLARVYRQEGDESAARTVMIAKQQARRAQNKRWWVRCLSWALSAFLRWTIGYGYRPALVLPYLAGLFVFGSFLLNQAYHAHPSKFTPAKTGSEQPEFNATRYTADLLLPMVNFKQRDAFVAHGWAAWVSFGFTFAGWLLAAVVVVGLTGVFKRD